MVSRRTLLKTTCSGFGYLALAALAHLQAARANEKKDNPLAPKETHFAARAKRVIFLCMDGGPSHVDLFDYKPKLIADHGQASPRGNGGFGGRKLLASPFQFAQQGQSGLWMSELFPELARQADSLCLINSMHTDLPNHAQAFLQLHCGLFQFPRPSLGAWVLYGLGTTNENLPGFITINPPQTNGGSANYAASFLPAVYQGTRIGRRGFDGEQVSNLRNPRRTLDAQRVQLDYVQELNRATAESLGEDPAIEGLIESYELAFRMQGEMPQVLDLGKETSATHKLYGIEEPRGGERGRGFGPGASGTGNFGRQCLLARRLIEAGVRFVEVTMSGWDHHRNLKESLTNSSTAVDKPMAALLADLKSRGLLEDTLVVWGGEFGRSPYAQGDGRDHNNKGYTMWLAGGGVKGGLAYGKTDDYGFEAVDDKVHVHDLHATILYLLGLDHESLTYRYAGRDMRLTDVKGNVVKALMEKPS
ncbi:MAG: DUF1501 domain-containing protein [Planctomycetes bacterium]|nr:DUF1501 domain-containing protein [Planctomycetota bacterium]